MSGTEPLLLDCGQHGKRTSTVVCQHLLSVDRGPLGFVENSDDPNDLQAWCGLCEELYEREGEMTQKFRELNGMCLVCVVCYEEAKARHSVP